MLQLTKKTTLPTIKKYLPDNPLIVEAGAFDGCDTKHLSAFFPHGQIHSFEPVPEIFALLEENTKSLSNVTRHQYALGDSIGSTTLHISEKPSEPGQPFQAGSLLKPKERLTWSDVTYPRTIKVPITTLDDWAAQRAIDHVDFLWLDMQGYELNVLKASQKILPTVKVIFTEVEFIEAYEGQYQYEDVRAWLESQGFTMVGKDFPDKPTWFFGNALFVRQ